MTDSETRGWKRNEYGDWSKVIDDAKYVIWKRTTGFWPGEFMVARNGQLLHEKQSRFKNVTTAKRAAHKHARERA